LVANRVAKVIAEYERNRTNPDGAGGARENVGGTGANTGGVRGVGAGIIAPEGRECSYKTFSNYKPHSFNETERVVGLSRWFEKIDSFFHIKQEMWNLTMKGDDIDGYTNRFHELPIMCPTLVTPECKKIERYIWGFPKEFREM
nr:hypothetical protein [Tanacetum cinerariifolium]